VSSYFVTIFSYTWRHSLPTSLCRNYFNLAAGLFIAIWFLHAIIQVILLIFFAIVISIVLNAPVTWLQRHNFSRTAASLLVFFGVIAY